MRFLRRLVIFIVCLAILVLLFAPPLIGIGLQKFATVALFFNNSNVEIITYDRRWFDSDAKVRIKLNNSSYRKALDMLGVSTQDIPDNLDLIANLHITHGPIFYIPSLTLPCRFGIALVDRQLSVPPEQKDVFAALGMNESLTKVDRTCIDFQGNFLDHIELTNFYLHIPSNNSHVSFGSVNAYLWHSPFTDKVKGRFVIVDLNITGKTVSLTLPNTALQFDLKKDANGLWIGSHDLSLTQIVLRDANNESISINGIKTDGNAEESGNLLNADKHVSVQELQVDHDSFGPIYLEVSAHQINAEAISNLFSAYQDISQNGELYQSQLKQKILSILPRAISSGSSIQLNKLDLTTPEGQLHLDAKASWTGDKAAIPNNVPDLIQAANLQAGLRIAVPLAQQVIGMLSKIVYLDQITDAQRSELIAMNQDVQLQTQQNVFALAPIVDANMISKTDAEKLLQIMKNHLSKEDYYNQVKSFLYARKITLGMAYMLDMEYMLLYDVIDSSEKRLQELRDNASKDLKNQMQSMINQGYITLEGNDYIVNIVRENSVMKVNGREVNLNK